MKHRAGTPGTEGWVVDLDEAITWLREQSVDDLASRGLSVQGTFDEVDDPILLGPDGQPVESWRQEHPYDTRMSREDYETTKRLLQIELLKAQTWLADTGGRLVVSFDGRDAAGKGGTIKRFVEHLNPRGMRVVALAGADRPRAGSVVLPALRRPPADRRRDRAVRPVLVQPGRRRTRDGLLHRRGVRGVHAGGSAVRGDARAIGHRARQTVVLGVASSSRSLGSRSGASIRSASGSSARSTLRRWTDGTTTPTPRTRCSAARITSWRRGRS